MVQNFGGGATGVFEGVGQDGETGHVKVAAGQIPVLVGGLGENGSSTLPCLCLCYLGVDLKPQRWIRWARCTIQIEFRAR